MLDFKPVSTPIDINVKLGKIQESPLVDKESFHRLIG